MNKSLVAVIVVVLIALGAGGFLLTRKSTDTKESSTNQSATSTTPSTGTSSSEESSTDTSQSSESSEVAATITYSDSGFSPDMTTVASGSKVAIKNTSSRKLEFDSDPHPIHTSNKELNVGEVDPGQTMTFTVTTKGTFGIHNHLNASETTKLTVN